MKLRYSLGKAVMIAILSGSMMSVATLAQVQSSKDAHKPTLRAIMQDLGAEYLRLANALMMEDFKVMEESAKAIQSHPLPEAIIVAIKSRLGRKFGAFEQADELSHRSAAELVKRAAVKDTVGSARAFAGITNGCVSCHRQFRTTLKTLSD